MRSEGRSKNVGGGGEGDYGRREELESNVGFGRRERRVHRRYNQEGKPKEESGRNERIKRGNSEEGATRGLVVVYIFPGRPVGPPSSNGEQHLSH